ncbi:MAG: hypothetical protein ACRDQB_06890 [Thermocrispum sp.]
MRVWRKAAAASAATAIAMGTAAFAAPGVASAETRSTNCGGKVTAQPGDTVRANTSVLGLNLGTITLGTVQASTTTLARELQGVLGKVLCEVTVTVTGAVDDVAEGVNDPAPKPLKPVTEPATGVVTGGTEQLRQAAGATNDKPAENGKTNKPGKQNGTKPEAGDPETVDKIPASSLTPTSQPYGGSLAGFAFPYSSPMNSFGGAGALFDTVPGLRYGTGFDGYAPQFGLLGDDGLGADSGGAGIRNAGSANALAPEPESGIGLPMLLAVLALAGASAGLVRTWVLRTVASAGV